MVPYYSKMLHDSWLGAAVAGGIPWLSPTFAILHFFGMALLIGSAATIDLRLLGLAKALPLRPLQKLVPWGILGFVINLASGVGLYSGNPGQFQNAAFAAKMAFVVIAGLNAILFYTTGLASQVNKVAAEQDAPLAAKLVAGASLFLWVGVIYCGRMLPFFGTPF